MYIQESVLAINLTQYVNLYENYKNKHHMLSLRDNFNNKIHRHNNNI